MAVRSGPDKITLADVARRAGVSTMTVSRVVNERDGVRESTRHRVRAAIEELGYRPNIVARGFKTNRSRTLGLLVPDITNPYFPEIVRGAEDVAFESGYTVLLNNAIEDVERESLALQAFEDRRVDGVVACSPRMDERRLYDLLARHDAAVVVDRNAPAEVAGSVRVDHEYGGRVALEHLHAEGRRRVGVLSGPESSSSARARLRGIAAAAAELGLEIPPRNVLHVAPTLDGGVAGTARLLEIDPDVDALVGFNDLVAAGALRTLHERGRRVPEDVAVTGYDDIPYARMFMPALTTLRVATYDLGVHAVRMLLDRMHGRHPTLGIVLQPELVIRGSSRRGDAA